MNNHWNCAAEDGISTVFGTMSHESWQPSPAMVIPSLMSFNFARVKLW